MLGQQSGRRGEVGEVANLHARGIEILYINGPITWTSWTKLQDN